MPRLLDDDALVQQQENLSWFIKQFLRLFHKDRLTERRSSILSSSIHIVLIISIIYKSSLLFSMTSRNAWKDGQKEGRMDPFKDVYNVGRSR